MPVIPASSSLSSQKQSALPPEVPVVAPRVGVVAFDNDAHLRAGWAFHEGCVGGEPFRIRAIEDLPSNFLWVSNAKSVFDARSHHGLRDGSYARTTIGDIADDIGLRMGGAFSVESLPKLVEILSRVVGITAKSYVWRKNGAFAQDSLAGDIFLTLPKIEKPIPAIDLALRSAFQRSSQLKRAPWNDDAVRVTVRTNRMLHARTILDLPIPDAAWDHIHLPDNYAKRLEMALDLTLPTLVEARISFEAATEKEAALICYGQPIGPRATSVRVWLSQPELVWVSKFATVEVTDIWRSRSYVPLAPEYKLPAALMDPYLVMSYSAGLVAEAHLTAVADDRQPGVSTRTINERIVWLRAYDRALSFSLALDLLREGFSPVSYWLGCVTLKVPRCDLARLGEVALAKGLMAPSIDLLRRHVLEGKEATECM